MAVDISFLLIGEHLFYFLHLRYYVFVVLNRHKYLNVD